MNPSQRLPATRENNTFYFCRALILYNYDINCGRSKHSLKRNYLSSAFVAVGRGVTGFLRLWLYFPFSLLQLISLSFLSSSPSTYWWFLTGHSLPPPGLIKSLLRHPGQHRAKQLQEWDLCVWWVRMTAGLHFQRSDHLQGCLWGMAPNPN